MANGTSPYLDPAYLASLQAGMGPAADTPAPTSVDLQLSSQGPQLTPEQQQILLQEQQRIRGNLDTASARRRGSIEQLRQTLQEKKDAKPGFDLTPAFMLADMLNKQRGQQSTLAATYAQSGSRPETENQRQQKILELQQTIDGAEQKALDAETRASTSLMKSLQGQYVNPAKLKQDAINERFKANKALQAESTFEKDYQKVADEFQDTKRAFGQLNDAMRTGDLQIIKSNAAVFARVVAGEKGVLTDRDILRVIPATVGKDAAELERYITEEADVSDADWVKALTKMVKMATEKQRDMYKGRIKSRKDTATTLKKYDPIRPQVIDLWDTFEQEVDSAFTFGADDKSGDVGTRVNKLLDDPNIKLEDIQAYGAGELSPEEFLKKYEKKGK